MTDKHLTLLMLLAVAIPLPGLAAETADRRFEYAFAPLVLPAGLITDAHGLVLEGRDVAGYESAIIESPFPFTAVGAHWLAQTPAGTSLTVELATSPDGRMWSAFHVIPADTHLTPTQFMPDGKANPSFGETVGSLLHRSRGDGRFVRFRLHLTGEAATRTTPTIERLTLTFIDSRVPSPSAERDTGDRGASTEARAGAYPKPPVNSRAAWGAAPPTCTYSYCNVTHIAVHHTAGVSEYTCSGFDECAADVRAIQAYHMNTNGWCDIGYNYLASSDGQLWEGRGGGDDVRGAHDGYNCGSMGVSNMGYFHPPYDHAWTEAQLDAFAGLSAWKADQKAIDPYGVSFYSGLGANMDNMYGHRDVSSTACPGDTIYPRLDELRDRTAAKLGGGGTEFIYDNPAVSFLIGNWTTGTSSGDKYGADYYWASTGGGEFCVWRVDIDTSGTYDVSFWWPEGSNRSPTARLLLKDDGPIQVFSVNQQTNGGQWNSIGSFSFTPGPVFLGVSNAGQSGYVVMCDAVRLSLQ